MAAAGSFTGTLQGMAGATMVPWEMVAKLVNFLRLSWLELHDLWGNPDVSHWLQRSRVFPGQRLQVQDKALLSLPLMC